MKKRLKKETFILLVLILLILCAGAYANRTECEDSSEECEGDCYCNGIQWGPGGEPCMFWCVDLFQEMEWCPREDLKCNEPI